MYILLQKQRVPLLKTEGRNRGIIGIPVFVTPGENVFLGNNTCLQKTQCAHGGERVLGDELATTQYAQT